MMGRTHKIGGAVMAFVILNALLVVGLINIKHIFISIPFIVSNIIGALLCDIDSRKSTISRFLWIIAIPIWILQKILNFLLKNSKSTLAKNIKKTINHRGFAHWPIVYIFLMFIITIFVILTNNISFSNNENNYSWLIIKFYPIIRMVIFSFLYGICTGALSHIFLDALNPTGVPLLAPFSFKRKHFMNIETSSRSKSEKVFRFILKIILFLLLILYFFLNIRLLI